MHVGRTVFAQLMDFLPLSDFRACVARYDGDYKVRSFSCLDQLLTLAIARRTLAEANETRDWRIYQNFAHGLIATARGLYATEDLGLALTNTVYAFDATTIDLCLSLFPWATFRQHKGAIYIMDRGYLDFARLHDGIAE